MLNPALMTSQALRESAGHLITVAMGEFTDLFGPGVARTLREDRGLLLLDLQGGGLVDALTEQRPDVAVLDIDALKAVNVRQLRSAAPTTGIVALTHSIARVQRIKALGSDVACVLKDASAAELAAAVRVAAERARATEAAARNGAQCAAVSCVPGFTPRENQVHACLSAGLSDAQTADALHIAVDTVRSHTAHMRSKVGVKNNRQLIAAVRSHALPARPT
jgi:DNA-binding NarL/FixJ family response regulator